MALRISKQSSRSSNLFLAKPFTQIFLGAMISGA